MPQGSHSIRRAAPGDAPGIAAIHRLAWPREEMDPARVGRVLAEREGATFVAAGPGGIVGFIDSFPTRDPAGGIRWELDLMAVHPDHRGGGLGGRLVRAAVRVGLEWGASPVRGLVRVENLASRRMLTWCAFRPEPIERCLMVADPGTAGSPARAYAAACRVIPVRTLTYRGWWLEPRAHPSRPGPDAEGPDPEIIGMVVAREDRAARESARAAGFRVAGRFHWWHLRYGTLPGR